MNKKIKSSDIYHMAMKKIEKVIDDNTDKNGLCDVLQVTCPRCDIDALVINGESRYCYICKTDIGILFKNALDKKVT